MNAIAANQLQDDVVLILDTMKLRSAGLASLLEPWARLMGMKLQCAGLESVEQIGSCRMVVLSVGGSTVSNPEILDWIKHLRAKWPETALVVVSDREDSSEVARAFGAGANGFIPTNYEPEITRQALSFIIGGGSFFPPTILTDLPTHSDIMLETTNRRAQSGEPGEARLINGFTPRQQEVLELLRRGDSNKVIGRRLSMTEATVKVHVRQIMRKLGASNRTQAALICSSESHQAAHLFPTPQK
ncbi:LuxR C-terminal-related transcriptional regulator [Microvirga subterranea]|uniref:DNA-binding NarL/FixJ family response regulator n=1 Tax=Microvirga subterranea TaxID=186651 RepID=A0A370HR67_9HYPH|nr:response regulator transcription factor [Microvirga subterranea]RDI60775.1 DNA-binding NarL/FixJ family response regulator [Microvirga subterranea]